MSSKPTAAFGGLPEDPILPDMSPLHAFHVEWPWLRPLSAILQFSRWTIDDVVSNPRAAAEVRLFWKILQTGKRISRERQARSSQPNPT